jgi:hypothetical protein
MRVLQQRETKSKMKRSAACTPYFRLICTSVLQQARSCSPRRSRDKQTKLGVSLHVSLAAARCMRVLHFRCPGKVNSKRSVAKVLALLYSYSASLASLPSGSSLAISESNQVGSPRIFLRRKLPNFSYAGASSVVSFFPLPCMHLLCRMNNLYFFTRK